MPAFPPPRAAPMSPWPFITGYDSSGEVPEAVDWGKLAGGIPVLVFYMALAHLARSRGG